MKRLQLLALVLVCSFSLSTHADAQFWKKVKDRVKNRAENRALNEVDKSTDKVIDDALEGNQNEDSSADESEPSSNNDDEEMSQQEANQWMAKMLGGGGAPLPAQYDLNYIIDYKVTSDGEVNDMSYMIGDDVWGFRTQQKKEEMMMIIDADRDIIAMYSERKGKKTVQKLPSMMSSQFVADAVDDSEEVPDDYSIEKTGNTKDIAGYRCEEYAASGPDGHGTFWMAPDVDANLMEALSRSMKKSKKMKKISKMFSYLNGTMLESNFVDKKGKTNHMIATKVNASPASINHSDYEEVSLGE